MSKREKFRPANSWWQRWRRYWRAWRGAGELKRHRVELVAVNGFRCKRVLFDSEPAARQVAGSLTTLEPLERFPKLIERLGKEVRVEYVPGPLARPVRDERELLDFFSELYCTQACLIGLAESGLLPRLAEDLAFLVQHGRLDFTASERLLVAARSRAPEALWMGYDYIDPVLKNFVLRSDGRAIGIDIEALLPNQPLGVGLAKARLRWLRPGPNRVLDAVASAGGPKLADQYSLVEVCFLAGYFRQKIIQRKPRHIRIQSFKSWLEGVDIDGTRVSRPRG